MAGMIENKCPEVTKLLSSDMPISLREKLQGKILQLNKVLDRYVTEGNFDKQIKFLNDVTSNLRETNTPQSKLNCSDLHLSKRALIKKSLFENENFLKSKNNLNSHVFIFDGGKLKTVPLTNQNLSLYFPSLEKQVSAIIKQPKEKVPLLTNILIQTYIDDIDEEAGTSEVIKKIPDVIKNGGDCNDVMGIYYFMLRSVGFDFIKPISITNSNKIAHSGVIVKSENKFLFLDQYKIVDLGNNPTDYEIISKIFPITNKFSYDPSETNIHIFKGEDLLNPNKKVPEYESHVLRNSTSILTK